MNSCGLRRSTHPRSGEVERKPTVEHGAREDSMASGLLYPDFSRSGAPGLPKPSVPTRELLTMYREYWRTDSPTEQSSGLLYLAEKRRSQGSSYTSRLPSQQARPSQRPLPGPLVDQCVYQTRAHGSHCLRGPFWLWVTSLTNIYEHYQCWNLWAGWLN